MDGALAVSLLCLVMGGVLLFFSGVTVKDGPAGVIFLLMGLLLMVFGLAHFGTFFHGTIAVDNKFAYNDLEFSVPYENMGEIDTLAGTVFVIRSTDKTWGEDNINAYSAYLFPEGNNPPSGLFVKVVGENGEPVYMSFGPKKTESPDEKPCSWNDSCG